MKLKDCMDEKTAVMIQDLCQKMREIANEQLADEDCRKEFFMCMATHFFFIRLQIKIIVSLHLQMTILKKQKRIF